MTGGRWAVERRHVENAPSDEGFFCIKQNFIFLNPKGL